MKNLHHKHLDKSSLTYVEMLVAVRFQKRHNSPSVEGYIHIREAGATELVACML